MVAIPSVVIDFNWCEFLIGGVNLYWDQLQFFNYDS
jgi:hypothetical protein